MTEPPPRKNRIYAPRKTPEERREHLLDAALRVMVEQGIHKVSMDAVAREAKVTRPVMYGVFDGSPGLLEASLDREEQAALHQVADILAGDLVTSAVGAFEEFLQCVLAEPLRWRAIFMLDDSPSLVSRERIDRNRRAVLDLLERGIRKTGNDPDPGLTARITYAAVWEAGRLVLTEPDSYPPDRLIAAAARAVSAYFAP